MLLSIGCEFTNEREYYESEVYVDGEIIESNCRHRAMYTASVAISHGYEYDIVRGMYLDEHHAQTRALIDGEWYWLFLTDENVYAVETFDDFTYCEDNECLYDIREFLELVERWTDLRD